MLSYLEPSMLYIYLFQLCILTKSKAFLIQNPRSAKTPYYAKWHFPSKMCMRLSFPLRFPLAFLCQSCFLIYRLVSEWVWLHSLAHLLVETMPFNDILLLVFWTTESSENLQIIRALSSPRQLISSAHSTRWNDDALTEVKQPSPIRSLVLGDEIALPRSAVISTHLVNLIVCKLT